MDTSRIRLANLEHDFWQLWSAEEAAHQYPETFQIPALDQRQNLQCGQAARLIFDIECKDENGKILVQGERMWVIVAERFCDVYIGILDDQPISLDKTDDVYLCFGAEIPFQAEHVIDIAQPPPDYIEWQLSQPPERTWNFCN